MRMTRTLFCPPTYFEIRDLKNPFMRDAGPVDKEKALEQWEALRHAFEQAEVVTEVIPAVPDLEDMVFANNQVFVGEGNESERFRFIVPSRMRFPSRQREVPYYVEWFRARGYRVIELDYGDEFLEGHGDLLWHADSSKVWAGYGIRSTRGGVERFAAAMRQLDITVIPLQLTDERFYHLDTCFAPLTAEAVVIYPGAFSPEALASIRAGCLRVHEVDEPEALGFVCNGVAANGRFITPRLGAGLARALKREGLEALVVETSEFEKSGGSVCCLKLFHP
ncbi:MAG TPA: arginine deiminase-related protein [Terriglobales bacterium]|nr:arginine deiminase-related protein [Terriglobales bacterium]